MKQATMVCAGVVLLAITGVSYKLRQAEEAAPMYAFYLPRMLFECVEFPMPKDGETVPSWNFEQAVHMNFMGLKGTIYMPGNYRFAEGCGFAAPITLALGTVKSLTFGPSGGVTIEQYSVTPIDYGVCKPGASQRICEGSKACKIPPEGLDCPGEPQ